jgi:hypothetical protein
VRVRLWIPAALLLAAAYLKGRWDGDPRSSASRPGNWTPAAVASAADEIAAAAAPAPESAEAGGLDLAGVAEWSAVPADVPPAPPATEHDSAVLAEWHAPAPAAPAEREPAPSAPVVTLDGQGRFSLGGWSVAAGELTLCAVTFPEPLEGVGPGRVRLVLDATQNVVEGGVTVLEDEGFAPDRDGFTLALASAGPGAFAAAGRYEVVPA